MEEKARQIRSESSDLNRILFIFIISSALGLLLTAYLTITREHVPSSGVTSFNNSSHDMDVLVEYEKNINIPLESFLILRLALSISLFSQTRHILMRSP
jgi:hypothetical protein